MKKLYVVVEIEGTEVPVSSSIDEMKLIGFLDRAAHLAETRRRRVRVTIQLADARLPMVMCPADFPEDAIDTPFGEYDAYSPCI